MPSVQTTYTQIQIVHSAQHVYNRFQKMETAVSVHLVTITPTLPREATMETVHHVLQTSSSRILPATKGRVLNVQLTKLIMEIELLVNATKLYVLMAIIVSAQTVTTTLIHLQESK